LESCIMATTNPGITLKPPFGGQVSDKDIYDISVGYAKTLLNWLKRGGNFAVRPGFSQLGSALDGRGCGVIQYDHHTGHRYTVVGTTGKWWRWNLNTLSWTDITEAANGLSGSDSTTQIFRVFYKSNKAFLIGVNGYTDAPKKWDGDTSTYSDMGGSPPKAKCMAISNNRLLLGNTYTVQANPQQVDVGGYNDFETGWGATQTTNLMDTPGEIMEMRELGNAVTAIYKTDSIYIASAQAQTEPFYFELKVPMMIGPASPRCVVSLPNAHIIMDRSGGISIFDGVQITNLSDSLRQYIINTADMGSISRSIGWYDAVNNEVWFIYRARGSGEPNVGLVINLADYSAWPISFQNFRPTAAISAGVEENVRIGDMIHPLSYYTSPLKDLSHTYLRTAIVGHTGIVAEDSGYTDIGDPIPMELETGSYSLPGDNKTSFTAAEIDCLFAKSPGSQEISIQVGTSEDGNDAIYGSSQVVNIGNAGPYSVGSRTTSRMLSLRLSASATQPIHWRGAVVSGSARGQR
jgi:hypothetical protein